MSDLPSWWSEPGRAGGAVAWLGAGRPWTLAGLSLGAWGIAETQGVPETLAGPGLTGVHTPLAWYDSVAVRHGGGAAWFGFGAPLATAEGFIPRAGARGGRTVVDVRGGDFGYDENGLTIARGDSARWLSVEVLEGRVGSGGGFESFGRHLWGVSGGMRRARHRLEAGYRQRGSAAILSGSQEQSASGESGFLRYWTMVGAARVDLYGQRGLDHHASFGDDLEGSRRDAQGTEVGAEARVERARDAIALRARWRREKIGRQGEGAFADEASSGWTAARYERRLGDGLLELGLGAGSHGALDGVEIAPEISYRTGAGPIAARIGVERLLHPAWSDLATGEAPFLQSTWAGALEVSGAWTALRARARLLGGSTADRALFHHLPLEDLWLREGARRDLEAYRFGLAALEGEWRWRGVRIGGEGFVLSRDRTGDEALADPAHGLRSRLEWGFAGFGGDLAVRLGAHLDRVGPRESELFGVRERELPAYWTSGATALVTLAGATISIGVRNLEDRPREDVWIDDATGVAAVGPGREWRFAFTLRLAN